MNMPVRVSLPLDSGRMPPGRNGGEYSCASGIIRYVMEQERDPFRFIGTIDPVAVVETSPDPWEKPAKPAGKGEGWSNFVQSIISLFKELF
jgi:cell division protein FtsA